MSHDNSYQRALSPALYRACPKAVLAAIAVSWASAGGEQLEQAEAQVLDEWWTLYDNRVVAQRPPFKRAATD